MRVDSVIYAQSVLKSIPGYLQDSEDGTSIVFTSYKKRPTGRHGIIDYLVLGLVYKIFSKEKVVFTLNKGDVADIELLDGGSTKVLGTTYYGANAEFTAGDKKYKLSFSSDKKETGDEQKEAFMSYFEALKK